tara:strand:- start:12082 stop:12561 length:480 start_codon:yes stop_codon:yes gene_type:complete
MSLVELYSIDDLDNVIEFISEKEFIKNVKMWLKSNDIKISTRVFISHYLLYKFNIFYGVPNNCLLYKMCGDIIEFVKNNKELEPGWQELYCNYFRLWKRSHSNDMINEYTETVEKLKEFREAEPDPENKEGYNIFQKTLEESIDMLKRNSELRLRRNTI